jgi:hypothetical protein
VWEVTLQDHIHHDKEALVSDYMDSSETYVHWNLSFLWAVQDRELEPLLAFLNVLYSLKIHPRETNKMLWSPARNHRFEVKGYYDTL